MPFGQQVPQAKAPWAGRDLCPAGPSFSRGKLPPPMLTACCPGAGPLPTVTTDTEEMVKGGTTLTEKGWGFRWQLRHLRSREQNAARGIRQVTACAEGVSARALDGLVRVRACVRVMGRTWYVCAWCGCVGCVWYVNV